MYYVIHYNLKQLYENATIWTAYSDINNKRSFALAPTTLLICKLLDILQSLLSIIGMKLLLFLFIVFS